MTVNIHVYYIRLYDIPAWLLRLIFFRHFFRERPTRLNKNCRFLFHFDGSRRKTPNELAERNAHHAYYTGTHIIIHMHTSLGYTYTRCDHNIHTHIIMSYKMCI